MAEELEIEGEIFEDEVRNVARNLWPRAEFGGSEIVDGRERDGVFVTDDIIHLIECTVSRRKDKALIDGDKLAKLIKKTQKHNPDKLVKGWFVTKDEPTADQRTVIKGYKEITAVSYERFRSKLVDIESYRMCRNNYPFGSVRDPASGNSKYNGEYILTDFSDMKEDNGVCSIIDIVEVIKSSSSIIIQGHYGVGKSMALKEIYSALMKAYDVKSEYKFPIYINLRDHQGQINPVEVIERHSRNIGFKNPEHIVRAWRAGYVTLILDGFDEISAFGWAGGTRTLRDIRYKSMELVREFIRQKPHSSQFIIAGRINYFDSIVECERAFGVSHSIPMVKLGDFSPEQTEEYLQNKKITIKLPNWVPTRPLLLGYIVSRGIIEKLLEHQNVDDPAEGWDYLIDEVCKRESQIESGITPEVVREIIEGITSYCRQFQSGLGPIYQPELEVIFTKVCGYPPDERALILLQRLPILSPNDQQDGARYLIDNMFTSVAKAGEVAKFIRSPYDHRIGGDFKRWQECLDELGIQTVANKISNLSESHVEDSLIQAKNIGADILMVDIFMTINSLGRSWKRENIVIKDVLIPIIEINQSVDFSRVEFISVIFKEFILEELPPVEKLPTLLDCIIGKLIGFSKIGDIKTELFASTTIDGFEGKESTTAAILGLDLPVPTKVGLTILRKLYLQSGNGRQENALYRGLSTNEKSYVSQMLNLLKHEEVIVASSKGGSDKVWQPVKAHFGRIRNIIISKAYSDPLISKMNLQ